MKKIITYGLGLLFAAGSLHPVSAQEDSAASISLSFEDQDTLKIIHAQLNAPEGMRAEKAIRFYAKRLFSLLPIGDEQSTDEEGKASVNFPTDLPGDEHGMVGIVAKIEDDEDVGTLEQTAEIAWGAAIAEDEHYGQRSLSAAREKAPWMLIISSNIIIAIVWGTLLYVAFQLFRIAKAGKKKKGTNIV